MCGYSQTRGETCGWKEHIGRMVRFRANWLACEAVTRPWAPRPPY